MILPTRKLLVILLIPVVLLAVVPASGVFLVLYNVIVAGIVVLDLLLSPRPADLVLTRAIPKHLSLDARNRVGWELHNQSRASVTFSLTDDVPETIERTQPTMSGQIVPRSHASLRYEVRPTRRGLYEFGDMHLRYRTVLGLAVRQRRIRERTPVKVYPNVANLARYELAMQRHRLAEIGLRTVRQRGKGTMFESLRDYVQGDDPDDIAWKATARRGRMIIRNYETERSQNVLLVIDCGRLMTTQVENLSRLDYAINASLLLTYVAMKQGDYIGLVAFDDKVQRYVPPSRGRGALRRMNEALYTLTPTLCEPNYEQACRFLALRHRKRSLIVLFTDVIDKDASAMLLAYTARFARQHLPLCVVMRNLEVERLVAAAPEDAVDCFSKSVGVQMLEKRTDALARMRHFGVDVLDTDPRELTPNVLNRYLSLKRRSRF